MLGLILILHLSILCLVNHHIFFIVKVSPQNKVCAQVLHSGTGKVLAQQEMTCKCDGSSAIFKVR